MNDKGLIGFEKRQTYINVYDDEDRPYGTMGQKKLKQEFDNNDFKFIVKFSSTVERVAPVD